MIAAIIPNKLAYAVAAGLVATSLSSYDEGNNLAPVVPERIEVMMDQAIVGNNEPFAIELRNNEALPMEILGVPGTCCVQGCVTPIDPPAVIPAYGSVKFRFRFKTKQPGPIDLTSKIFLKSGLLAGLVVPIRLRGNALDLGDQ